MTAKKTKMGRPTDNPKIKRVSFWLDAECQATLDAYTRMYKMSQSEAIRAAIKKLYVR